MTARFTLDELDSTYCDDKNRYVVSFIVGYGGDEANVVSAREAALAALNLTCDAGWEDTVWYVHDRVTGRTHRFEQSEFAEYEDGEFVFPDGDEVRASELQVGDLFDDCGEQIRITELGSHGDRVLITGEDDCGSEVETSFDCDTVVTLLDRADPITNEITTEVSV